MGGKTSRDKGKRGEYDIRDFLKKLTGVEWIRTPLSGGLHMSFPFDVMKQPGCNIYTELDQVGIEVKNTATIFMPSWIEQCKVAVGDYYMRNWAIFFKHKHSWYVTIPREYFAELIEKSKK